MKTLSNGILNVSNTQGDIFSVVIDKESTSTTKMIVYLDLIPYDNDLPTISTSVDILNETLIQLLESEHYTILESEHYRLLG